MIAVRECLVPLFSATFVPYTSTIFSDINNIYFSLSSTHEAICMWNNRVWLVRAVTISLEVIHRLRLSQKSHLEELARSASVYAL